MNHFTIKDITIDLHLKKEYILYQVSDLHLVSTNNDKEQNWFNGKKHFSNVFNEKYDDYYNHASSIEIFNDYLEFLNREKSDLVIFAGDLIDYYSDDNYNVLLNGLNRMNKKILYVYGNHDNELIKYDYNDFVVIDFDEFYVVGVDNSDKSFSHRQVELLKELNNDKKKIIMVYHIPVLYDNTGKEDSYFYIDYLNSDNDTKEFIDLMKENVQVVLCGHLHGYKEMKLFGSIPEFTSSSALIGYMNRIIIK